MIKRLDENTSLKFKSLPAEEKSKKGILGRLYGPVASFAAPTRNGRKYSQELWEKLFNSDLIKERFANGGVMGELTHPEDREEIAIDKVAVIMPEPPVKDSNGQLIGYVDILDTPCGRIAYQLAKYGYKFGISSRGTGDIIEGMDGEEVDPDTYQLNAFDLVEIPAVENARLTFTESLNTKKYGKTLRERLNEELNKASKDDKKLMKEALDDLGLNLDESSNKSITVDDIDKDKYPWLFDAFNCDAISLAVTDGALTNTKFDKDVMEENEIDSLEVKNDIERFAEHQGLEFSFNDEYAESLEANDEDGWGDDIKDELYDVFGKLEDIMYEVRNCVRGSYGVNGNKAEDLARTLNDASDELASIASNIYDNADEINENKKSIANEAFDPSGYTRAIEAINAGIETDEDEEALADYLAKIIGYCKSIADDYSLYIPALDDEYEESLNESGDTGSDIGEEEVVNDESKEDGIIAEFQEALKKATQLEADNLSLQEKLSVCNAKEVELREQLAKYKTATTKLSESVKSLKGLKGKLNEKDKIIADNKKIVEKLSKSELSANMKLSETESELNKYKADNKSLTEKLDNVSAKLTKSEDLVSRYKKSYAALRESYLDLKVTNYGLKKDEVKQKLGESYKIKDIDSVCEELSKVKANISKLPFRVNESTKISVKSTEKSTKSINDDDYISDSLLRMIN